VQVVLFWHMMKSPTIADGPGVPHMAWFAATELLRFHTPHTTPLLKVPVDVGVPLDVPVTPPAGGVAVNWSTLPACVPDVAFEVMVKLILPVTWLVERVVIVAEPPWAVPVTPVKKHGPLLMKLKPEIASPCALSPGVLLTLKLITKFRLAAAPVPPLKSASQFPLVLVVIALGGLLLPHP
jgi:hypothetical protein